MRTSDFSFLVLSSTVFHRPAGDGLRGGEAGGEREGEAEGGMAKASGHVVVSVSCRGRMAAAHAQNIAASIAIIGATPARAVRISVAVSGSSLAK